MNQQEVSPTSTDKQLPTYAKIYSRFASFIADSIITSILIATISGVFFTISSLPSLSTYQLIFSILGLIATFVVLLAYPTYFLSTTGATPGMKLVGIKTVKENGSLLTLKESLIRTFVYFLMTFFVTAIQLLPFIGIIISLILYPIFFSYCIKDQKKQNLYDKIFNNIYISENEKTGLAKVIIGCGCTFFIGVAIAIGVAIGLLITSLFGGPNTSSMSSESVIGILRMISSLSQGGLSNSNSSSSLEELTSRYGSNLQDLENLNDNTENTELSNGLSKDSRTQMTETSPSRLPIEMIKNNPVYVQCSDSIKNVTQDSALLSKYDEYCICAATEVIKGETKPQVIADKCMPTLQ